MSLTTLPLYSLILSRLNVRHTERDADVAALADDIAARGLKQNLVVVPAHFMTGEADSGWDEKWEVIAGGRRFQAMLLLVADGRLPADHPVPCLLEDRAEASETSLSENLHKVAMNPADEFAAFQRIVTEQQRKGLNEADAVAYTAKRFGATVKHVQGRLRLSTLCVEVLDALRANLITLDHAKAYAGTTNHELQRSVYSAHQKADWWGARDIRARLRGQTLPVTDTLVRFVGLDAYRAAGGHTETEMFMGADGEERVADVPLLKKLAQQIGDAVVVQQARNDGFKSGLFYTTTFPKIPAGFERAWDNGNSVSKTEKKKSIGVYIVDDEGLGLAPFCRLRPETKREEPPQRDWEAERREAERERCITAKAARMAAPSVKGTDFEGRTFWPTGPAFAWQREDDPDSEYLIQ